MADQICYAVLCVFSYIAAGLEQKKSQHSSQHHGTPGQQQSGYQQSQHQHYQQQHHGIGVRPSLPIDPKDPLGRGRRPTGPQKR
uniref:Uncharacterized protein n=2 Tax=Tetranychus urticae TaxID=32264 RepID=T1KIA3_TETUR